MEVHFGKINICRTIERMFNLSTVPFAKLLFLFS